MVRCDTIAENLRPDVASCLAGGTHTTRTESYRKIQYQDGLHRWVVRDPDGTVSIYNLVRDAATTPAPTSEPSGALHASRATVQASAALNGSPEAPHPPDTVSSAATLEPESGLLEEPIVSRGDDPTLETVPAEPATDDVVWSVNDDLVVPDLAAPAENLANIPETYSTDGTAVNSAPLPVEAVAQDEAAEMDSKYRWVLTSVEDTNGNKTTYSYKCPALPVCWPSAVTYNGIRIDFKTEGVSGDNAVTRANGIGLSGLNYRLTRITVSVLGQIQKSYELSYEISSSTELGRLKSVQQVGSGGTRLPAWQFRYQDVVNQQSGVPFQSEQYEIGVGGENRSFTYADLNGDGRQDVVAVLSRRSLTGPVDERYYVRTCRLGVRVSAKVNSEDTLQSKNAPSLEDDGPYCDGEEKDSTNYSVRTADFNGDGKADIAFVRSQRITVWISEWANSNLEYARYSFRIAAASAPCGGGDPCEDPDRVDGRDVALADIDGDGSVEFIVTGEHNPHYQFEKRKIYYWNGAGFRAFLSILISTAAIRSLPRRI